MNCNWNKVLQGSASALLAAGVGLAHDEHELSETVVLADRYAQPRAQSGSAASLIEGETLRDRQYWSLQEALNEAPGVFSTSTAGQRGQTGSLFMRGLPTERVQVRIDGVRITDASTVPGNFLSAAGSNGIGRIEVVRGNQGALFGGESVAGVIGIFTPRGGGENIARTRVESGSFDTFRGDIEASGMAGPLSYFVAGTHETTSNDPFSGSVQDFERSAVAARFDYAINHDWEVGITLRGSDAGLDTFDPFWFEDGELAPNPFAAPATFDVDWLFGTLFAEGMVNADWGTKLVLGTYREDFDSPFQADETRRWSLEWENHYEWNERNRTVAGLSAEETDFDREAPFGSDVDRTESLRGIYVNHLWNPVDHLHLSAGIRLEEYDSIGSQETHRIAASYEWERTGTRFRTVYGTGFRSPNLVELYGVASDGTFVGNPDLDPEDSRGWEFGISQPFGDTHEFEVTAFTNRIEDAIITPFLEMPFNSESTERTRGLEWEARGALVDGLVEYRVAHTFLDRRLRGVPRHVATANVQTHPTSDSMVGVGLSYVGSRNYGGEDLDGYFLARLYGEYHLNEAVTIHARVENLLDEDYEYSRFNFDAPRPGSGVGAFGGVTVRW